MPTLRTIDSLRTIGHITPPSSRNRRKHTRAKRALVFVAKVVLLLGIAAGLAGYALASL